MAIIIIRIWHGKNIGVFVLLAIQTPRLAARLVFSAVKGRRVVTTEIIADTAVFVVLVRPAAAAIINIKGVELIIILGKICQIVVEQRRFTDLLLVQSVLLLVREFAPTGAVYYVQGDIRKLRIDLLLYSAAVVLNGQGLLLLDKRFFVSVFLSFSRLLFLLQVRAFPSEDVVGLLLLLPVVEQALHVHGLQGGLLGSAEAAVVVIDCFEANGGAKFY